jgi:DNA-binding ferritin-like protein
MVATRSTLDAYPPLATDAARADILTEIVRGIDKWLWFVEAHFQMRPAAA